MIPSEVIDQILDRTDIVSIIERRVPLRRAGRNFKAPCPFHGEKTPSFVVSPDKQIYHCFGCGVGGNAISFIMKYDRMEFREAVRVLADEAHIEIPEDQESIKKNEERTPLVELHRLAAAFYANELKKAPRNSTIVNYIAKRGLDENALSQFLIGYSPEGWDRLTGQLANRFSYATILKAGLAVQNAEGKIYDRFRHRLMFPVRNIKGEVIGFGARALEETQQPKYLNSPETDLYHKGSILYGLYEALETIRKEDRVILVEGYMDVISCFKAGVTNAISPSGTALTPQQVKLIKRYTRNITTLFDADAAGQMATLRGLEILLEEDCVVLIGTMPEGEDPDSYAQKNGAQALKDEVLAKAKPFFDYKVDLLKSQHNHKTIEGKVKIANEMLKTISKIKNEVQKQAMIKELAMRIEANEEALRTELRRLEGGARTVLQVKVPQVTPGSKPLVPSRDTGPLEKMLIGLVVSFPELWQQCKLELNETDFRHSESKEIAHIFLNADKFEDIKVANLLTKLRDNDKSSRIVREAVTQAEHCEDPRRAYVDCTKRIALKRQEERIREIRLKIAECEKTYNETELQKWLMELNEFSRKKI